MKLKREWVVRVVKILLVIEIAWLVLANLFLSTGLAPWAINRKPEKRTITWEHAWTLWPACVYLRGLERAESWVSRRGKPIDPSESSAAGEAPAEPEAVAEDEPVRETTGR
ncbi:MAG: hypothetical protein GY719_22335 [bacterium]|nr:hypothetical protein [bacterium]